jgi:hypothetical protein
VDRTGRRRQLFTSLGAGLGVLFAVGCMLLIAGLLGSSPVPLPGLPQGGQGGLHRDDAGAGTGAGSSHSPAAPATTRPPAPFADPTAAVSRLPSATTGSPASAEPPGNRRTSHPSNPKPSRTK